MVTMQLTKSIQQFQKIEFFSQLDSIQLEKLISAMEQVNLLPGETVMEKGRSNDSFVFIEKGAIKFQEDKDILALLDGESFLEKWPYWGRKTGT
ncbi:MAG: cyclic nucleotide-binding domain-containing protein [Bacteroidia bacterium]|nr:cyclic nucleotide-binding domain-containing protein [Bacteroidia bacterium]